jgi:hypothetical protein
MWMPRVDGSLSQLVVPRGTEEPAVRHGLNRVELSIDATDTKLPCSSRVQRCRRGRKDETALGPDHFGVWSGRLESRLDLHDDPVTLSLGAGP